MTREPRFTRRQMLTTLGTTGCVALAGCGNRQQQATTVTGRSTVEVWGWDVAARSLDLTDDPFEEQHGGSVSVTEIPRQQLKRRFRDRIEAGRGAPTCSMMESVDGPAWIETGGLRDITGWIEDAGVREDVVSAKWEAVERDGRLYALPWDIGPVGTFYRRDIFAEHGIDPDSIETWEQFVAEGERLPADTYLLNIPSNDYDGFWRMQLRQLGGQPFTDDGKVNIHSGESLQVARNIEHIREAGVANDLESWSVEWFQAVSEGTIASLMGGSWMEGTLKSNLGETAGQWGVMRPPALEQGGSRATNWGGSNLVIPAQTSDRMARRAWEYMVFSLASERQQIRMYEEYGIFPAYRPAYESTTFDQPNPFFDGQRVGRLFADIAPQIEGYRFTADTPAVTRAINTHLSRMTQGETTPQQAIEDAAQQVADETGRELA